ncbi:MAG: Mov34/MPN/PAD-1 family protein [Planctomycetota bacterium]
MVPGSLVLSAVAAQDLAATARAAWPTEMVGLLAGWKGGPAGSHRGGSELNVSFFLPLLDASCTRGGFVVSPACFARGEAELRRLGLSWLGFAHSHCNGIAAPSATDRTELWRECVQLIVAIDGANEESLDDTRTVQLAAFWLTGEHCVPLPIAQAAALAAQ